MLKLYCDLPLRFVWSAAKVEKSGEIFQKPTVDQTEKKLDVEVSRTGGLQEAAEAAIASGGAGSEADVDTLVIKTADGVMLNYAQDIPYLQKNFMNATTVDLSEAVIEGNKFKSNVFKIYDNLTHSFLRKE